MLDERDRQYVQRFDAQQAAVVAALAAAKEAVTKAENASDKRFESVNEFRKTLDDQTKTFLTRDAYSSAHKALEDQVAASAAAIASLDNRIVQLTSASSGAGDAARWLGWIVALCVGGIAIIGFFRSRPLTK